MKPNPFIALLSACLTAVTHVFGQSSDALLNKLVEKGILTTDEARQLKAESNKNFTTAYASKSGMPEWVTALKFNGDFRVRYNLDDAANDAFVTRVRWRYRARFGFVATLRDDIDFGLRLGSGDAGNPSPLSLYQTAQDNASKKGVFLDQVYGRWSPLHTEEWQGRVTLGKLEDPFEFSQLGPGMGLGFDPDYTPEGAALDLKYQLAPSQTLHWINGAFVLDEISGSTSDPYLVGSQLRLESKWSPRVSSSLGVMLLSFANVDKLSNGAVPDANVGNTRYLPSGTNQANAVPLYQFNPILTDASVTYLFDHGPFYRGAFPVRLAASYLTNPAAPSSADNHAWSAGFLLGRAGRRGTWELAYVYKWLGANSIWEEVADDDFGAYWATTAGRNFGRNDAAGFYTGTDVHGHILRLSYSPSDALMLSVRWYHAGLIHEPSVPPGESPESAHNRLMVDADIKF